MPPKQKLVSVKQTLQKNLRKEVLRKQMENERKGSFQCNADFPSNPTSSRLRLLRTSKNSKENSLSFKISIDTTDSKGGTRQVKPFALSKTGKDKVQTHSRKLWSKVVCHKEIMPLYSDDSIMDGAALADLISPDELPVSLPIVPIATLVDRQTPPLLSPSKSSPSKANNMCLSPSEKLTCTSPMSNSSQGTSDSNSSCVQKKRRLQLSDQPPPMFKVPLRVAFKPSDLRHKIKGNVPPMIVLKTFSDDSISICAPTEIGDISDEDILNCREESPSTSMLISPERKADITNWLHSSSLSNPNLEPDKLDCVEPIVKCPIPPIVFDQFEPTLNSTVDDDLVNDQATVENIPVKLTPFQTDIDSSVSNAVPVATIPEVATTVTNELDSLNIQMWSDPALILSSTKNLTNLPSVINSTVEESPQIKRTESVEKTDITASASSDNSNVTCQTVQIKRTDSVEKKDIIPPRLNASNNEPKRNISSFTNDGILNKSTQCFTNTNHESPQQISNNQRPNILPINVSQVNRTNQTNQRPNTLPINVCQINRTNQNNQRQFHTLPHTNSFPPLLQNPPPIQSLLKVQIPQNRIEFNNYPSRPMFNGHAPNQSWPRLVSPSLQRFPQLKHNNYAPRGSDRGVFRRMAPAAIKPQPMVKLDLVDFDPNRPPPITKEPLWHPTAKFHQPNANEQQMPYKPIPMCLSEIREYIKSMICSYHYRGFFCSYGKGCRNHHQCSEVFCLGIAALKPEDLKSIVKTICDSRMFKLICEILGILLKAFVSRMDKISILELVQPILQVNSVHWDNMQSILFALCRLNMPYKDAVIKILHYVGSSNRKLVDILFAITTEKFVPSESTADWPAIEQLLDSASVIDYGVFAELCDKCLRTTDRNILSALAQTLLCDPCRVDVQRMGRARVGQLCDRMAQLSGLGALAAQLRQRWVAWEHASDRDNRPAPAQFDDPQLPTISSTLPGSINPNFNTVFNHLQKCSNGSNIRPRQQNNIEQRKNSCSPDSSSFAVITSQQRHVSQSPPPHLLSPPSHPCHPSLPQPLTTESTLPTNAMEVSSIPTLPQSFELRSGSLTPPFSTMATYSCDMMTTGNDCCDLRVAILKSQYNTAAVLLAKERESSVDIICKMINDRQLPVQLAFSFFDMLCDHLAEHSLQYLELNNVVLYILFNIYEFLIKDNNTNDAAHLLTVRFASSEFKTAFLNYKTFLPSGQCSPTQKCHKVIKLLLKEKLVTPCYDWFIRDEYQNVTLPSDLTNEEFMKEKTNLIEEFLTLSYRDLNIALTLIFFCIDEQLGDFKTHYNSILIQMINSTDHKEEIIKHRERFYSDEYVYLSTMTLRSYLVEFYCHLNLSELQYLYDRISREEIYPKLTGHENNITLRDTLNESEITLILTVFLRKIVERKIEVTWDIRVRFYTDKSTNQKMPFYPRNLIMYGNIGDAVKRLENVLKSCSFVQSGSFESKWHAFRNSGSLTLLKAHIQDMVRNYRGVQTFT